MKKVEVIARSVENDPSYVGNLFMEQKIRDDGLRMSGRAAGICYMPDDYLSEGIFNDEAALKRAKFNAKSGHYSVYDHYHISFILKVSKALAMVLNSTKLYATSEKSARYTKMKLSTEKEKLYYDKWIGIFSKLISAYDPDRTEKEVEKLAMENARYMTSITTQTTMEFTIPFSRAILLCQWLDNITDEYSCNGLEKSFINIIKDEAHELADNIRQCLALDKDNPILKDHKNMGIRMLENMRYKSCPTKPDVYGDQYSISYSASFAALAQLQRHRTLNYDILFNLSDQCYIPFIIRNTPYELEWKSDFIDLRHNFNVIPQCTLMTVIERGLFDDFILKCKERLCARTQYEAMEITRNTLEKFYDRVIIQSQTVFGNNIACNKEDSEVIISSPKLQEKICNMIKDKKVLTRCQFNDYICKEPCSLIKSNYYRNF